MMAACDRLVVLTFILACCVEAGRLRLHRKNAPLKSEQGIVFMRYMEERNLVVCGCGKCGTSSLYQYIWEKEFNREWPYGFTFPFVQEIESERWQGKFRIEHDLKAQSEIMKKSYSLALIRDPKERLISAWKSKLACPSADWHNLSRESEYGTDLDSAWFVSGLRKIQGLEIDKNVTCMTLEEFAHALLEIHQSGNAMYLDRHFLPQDLGCFYRFPPSHWSQLSAIDSPNVTQGLAQKFNASPGLPPATHNSWASVYVSQQVSELLDQVTSDEYAMLAPYLNNVASKVIAGTSVLLELKP